MLNRFTVVGISKDIRQRKFISSRQKALINILYTYGWALERIKSILSLYDLTHHQFNILRILRGSYPHPLSTLQIRQRMLDKMSDTSRIVDRLVIKGMLQKKVSHIDKRLVDILITEKGQAVLKEIDRGPDVVLSVMNNVSEDEMEQLSNLLDRIRSSEKNA
ncbi:MAG TPA: MarR family transcriptional regulator [Flavisolibacter sp.]|jgi:MarR family transcriptional regulator, 2-MHQ and catechol-resistance regulon repressor|nr:MarR family transcriptional regulator [Flavisolibacter sp.]